MGLVVYYTIIRIRTPKTVEVSIKASIVWPNARVPSWSTALLESWPEWHRSPEDAPQEAQPAMTATKSPNIGA